MMPTRHFAPLRALALLALLGMGTAHAAPREIIDAHGRTVVVEDTSRIASIGGSITEILYALGLDEHIVAVDVTSLYPPEALRDKPNVGYLRTLAPEGVLSVSPTLVLAEDDAGPPAAIELLESASVPFVLVPGEDSPQGVADKIRIVGRAMDASADADRLAADVLADFAALEDETAGIGERARALFVFSLRDGRIMAAGSETAADAMLRLAGAENAISGFTGYKPVDAEAVLAAAPEAIVIMERRGEGPGLAVEDVLADPTLAATPAGQAGNVIAMDGTYMLGFGPRAAHAAHDLAEALYPDLTLPALASRPWVDESGGTP